MSKFLIIRFSSIGDIVLTTPVVRNIKKQLQGSEIHFCTKTQFRSVVENNPYIDKVHYYENSLNKLLKILRSENYDYIIDLHNNLRSFLIKALLTKKAYSFNKLNFKKWLLVNFKIDLLPDIHIVDRYMLTVQKLGVVNDGAGLDYFIPERDILPSSTLPETHRKAYTAMVIGAQHATKKLPKELIVELCKKIPYPILLLGGPGDKEAGDYIEERLKKENIAIYNACGKLNLNQSASLLKQSSFVFSHDTGLMHIAAAFKKEIFSIWGNTTPRFGMYPYSTVYHVLENSDLKCRPCSKIGYNSCPKGHFKCMSENPLEFKLSETSKR